MSPPLLSLGAVGVKSTELVSKFAQVPFSVDIEDAVEDAAKLMRDKQVGSIVVVEGKKKPMGIVTEWDLLTRVVAEGRNAKRTRVREIMSSPLVQVAANTKVGDAVRIMINRGIRRLCLTEDGVLVGMVTLNQVVGNRRRGSTLLPMVERITGHDCPYCSLRFKLREQLSSHIRSTHLRTLKLDKAVEKELET